MPHIPPISRAVAWPSPVIVRVMREFIIAAGGDPIDIPEITPARFLRLPEVRQLMGISTSSLYRMMAAGEFPRPVPIDRAASRRVA